jgi:pyruvate/2-oxoglutarate dehydrogenase complex dihydrolipoamide dehydrogenase (E3) component
VATVSLTPVRAAEQGVALETHCPELAKVERAFIDGEEEGFAALCTRKSSLEISEDLVAAHAGEIISELTLAPSSALPGSVLRSRYQPRQWTSATAIKTSITGI